MITFSHVSLRTHSGMALRDIDCTIAPEEFVCIVGSAGSGKSALLALLTGERKPTQGKIMIDGVDLAVLSPSLMQLYRREIGVMLQDDQLLPDRSIASNVALALELRKVDQDAIAERVTDLLEKLSLYEKVAHLPEALSKGERRRIVLAQAISCIPKILILDEPFGDIDKKSTQIMHSLLRELHREGTTIVLTTHNPKTIESLGTRTIRLEGGKFVQDSEQQVHVQKKTSTHITPSTV